MTVKSLAKRMEWVEVRIWDNSNVPVFEGSSAKIPKKLLKRKIRKEDGIFPFGDGYLRITLEEK